MLEAVLVISIIIFTGFILGIFNVKFYKNGKGKCKRMLLEEVIFSTAYVFILMLIYFIVMQLIEKIKNI